jgi:hypothetical protein
MTREELLSLINKREMHAVGRITYNKSLRRYRSNKHRAECNAETEFYENTLAWCGVSRGIVADQGVSDADAESRIKASYLHINAEYINAQTAIRDGRY